MNWDAMGAIAELIGGIAVLATLVYLAIQVKQNNFMQKQQTITTQTNRCIESGKIIATDPEFADLYMKAMKGKDLTGTELSRLSGFLFSVLTDFNSLAFILKNADYFFIFTVDN